MVPYDIFEEYQSNVFKAPGSELVLKVTGYPANIR